MKNLNLEKNNTLGPFELPADSFDFIPKLFHEFYVLCIIIMSCLITVLQSRVVRTIQMISF